MLDAEVMPRRAGAPPDRFLGAGLAITAVLTVLVGVAAEPLLSVAADAVMLVG